MPQPARPRCLGVIGGMGPAATAEFFARFVRAVPARAEADHPRVLIDCDPGIPDRTRALTGAGPSPGPRLAAAAQGLMRAGAQVLAMPCNTAHHWFPEIEQAAGVPVLHMIRLAARAARERWGARTRVGVLATKGTLAAGLYETALRDQDMEPVPPTDREVDELLMPAIYGAQGVKTRGPSPEARAQVTAAGRALAGRGAGALLLGCTELSLLVDPGSPCAGLPVLDALEVLVQAAVARVSDAHADEYAPRGHAGGR